MSWYGESIKLGDIVPDNGTKRPAKRKKGCKPYVKVEHDHRKDKQSRVSKYGRPAGRMVNDENTKSNV